MADLYDRQKKLDLKIPKCVAVVGVGGVGSWVALNLALTGVQSLIIIDHDAVEEHNLNRTPFRYEDIGEFKVVALTSLIFERREMDVTPVPSRIENCDLSLLPRPDVVVDCRDISAPLPQAWKDKVKITGGYDGMSITIHVNPRPESVWGDGPVTYTVTPSWLVPPQLIANIITAYICSGMNYEKEHIATFTVSEKIKKLIGGSNE